MKNDAKYKYEVERHCENGGKVEVSRKEINEWTIATDPGWNWHRYDYRIAKEPVELLYEWIVEYNDEEGFFILDELQSEFGMSERDYYAKYKTGRCFNPETKELGSCVAYK